MVADPTFTVPQAAQRVGTSEDTVRRWIYSGRLASIRVGARHLVSESELLVAAIPRSPRGRPRRGYPRPTCEWCRTPLAPETGGYVVDIPPAFGIYDVHEACYPKLVAAIKHFVEKR